MKTPNLTTKTSRREFLSRGTKVLTATALLSTMPKAWVGNVYAASDNPEVTDLKFGIIALTDCAPFVIAYEKGFFKKYGINATITKGASWAAIRDNLCSGDIQATHMLLGMPLASTMGLAGSPKKTIVTPWIINRNGQGITLDAKYKTQHIKNATDLKPLVEKASAQGTPLTFAMTFPPGTHALWLRYWLGMGGINPDKDISLITVPPPQMIANMKVGKMDGFCVGEPWNARAVSEGIGYTVTSTQKIWPDHPEKVCAFTGEFAAKNPKTVKAVLKALHDASVWLDQISNKAEACQIIGKPAYINCDPASIQGRMEGDYDYGTGEKAKESNYMIFSERNANYPSQSYAKWFLSQYRRWGLTEGVPAYDSIAKEVMRGDLCVDAMKEIGVTITPDDNQVIKLCDSTFNPADPEAYAKSFTIKNLKG